MIFDDFSMIFNESGMFISPLRYRLFYKTVILLQGVNLSQVGLSNNAFQFVLRPTVPRD